MHGENMKLMINTFQKLKKISLQFCLIVNGNKPSTWNVQGNKQLDRLTVGNIQIDQVRSFSCLGTIVNGNNTLEEKLEKELLKEIKHSMRIEPFLKANWCPGNPN